MAILRSEERKRKNKPKNFSPGQAMAILSLREKINYPLFLRLFSFLRFFRFLPSWLQLPQGKTMDFTSKLVIGKLAFWKNKNRNGEIKCLQHSPVIGFLQNHCRRRLYPSCDKIRGKDG